MEDFDKRREFITELIEDVEQNYDILQNVDNQLNRRNYVRSLFSLYEAALSNLREVVGQLVVSKWDLEGEQKFHEILPILDEQVSLSGNGMLKMEPNRFPFIPLVAHCFKKYAELIEYNGDILGDHKWDDFKKSVKIRHRITHPKYENEVRISDEDLTVIKNGELWWIETRLQLYKQHEEWMKIPKAAKRPDWLSPE